MFPSPVAASIEMWVWGVCNVPAGALTVSFAAASEGAAGAVAGAGSDGFVGVGADALVLVGAGAWAEDSVSLGWGGCWCFFFLLKRPRKLRFRWSIASGAVDAPLGDWKVSRRTFERKSRARSLQRRGERLTDTRHIGR